MLTDHRSKCAKRGKREMCSFGSCKTCFEFLSQFRKVRNAFECFVTQVQTRLPKSKRVWPMKINVICTVCFMHDIYMFYAFCIEGNCFQPVCNYLCLWCMLITCFPGQVLVTTSIFYIFLFVVLLHAMIASKTIHTDPYLDMYLYI